MITRFLPLLGWIVCLIISMNVLADDKGIAIAEKIYHRDQGQDSTTYSVMTLVRPGGAENKRQFHYYYLQSEDGTSRSLQRFTSPPEVKGTGLLTADRSDEKSDQWIYLSALKKARRIASGSRGGQFVGSDFAYEDFLKRNVSMDFHDYKAEEDVEGIRCLVIESRPKKNDSIYSKKILWVHPSLYIPIQVDFFTKNSIAPSKRLKIRELRQNQGIWTAMTSEMENLKTRHKTRIQVTEIKYNTGLRESLFTRQSLEDEVRERSLAAR